MSGIDLRVMLAVHHGLRRDLRRLAVAAAATPPGDRRTWRALLRRWDLFTEILADHHHNEDAVVWPLLRERAAAAGAHEALEALDEAESEHEGIDAALAGARAALVAAGGPAAAAAVAEVSVAVLTHLDHEEERALPLLSRFVGADEWDAVQARLAGGPPLRLLLHLPAWILDELPSDLAEPLLAGAGAHLRLAARAGAPWLRLLDRRAFRHVPQRVLHAAS